MAKSRAQATETATGASTGSAMASTVNRRELVFQDGSSHKFWTIELNDSAHTVNFGRVGTNGQQKTKEFESDAEARKSFDKLVAEKLKKGYIDENAATGNPNGSGTSTAPAADKASKPAQPANARVAPSKAAPSRTTKVAKTATSAKPAKTAKSAAKTSARKAESESTVAAVPTSAAKDAVDLEITRTIDLLPVDWARATFRPRQVQSRGEAAAFDLQDCVKRLSKLKTENYGWDYRWEELQLAPALSREEAHFWLTAMTTNRKRETKPKKLAESLATKSFDGKVTTELAAKLMQEQQRSYPAEIALVLVNLFSLEELLELMFHQPSQKTQTWEQSSIIAALMDGFAQFLLPYLTDDELNDLRDAIRKNGEFNQPPADYYVAYPLECYLGALVGMHAEIYEITSGWEDERYQGDTWTDHYQRPQDLVFGLGSSELVEAEWRRLKLKMRSAEHVRAFLACTEFAALDCVRDSVLAETNKERCEELLTAFALVHAPEVAQLMLDCKLSSKSPAVARDWLDQNVGNAVVGLIPTAAGRGNLADAAVDYLRGIKRLGHADVVATAVKKTKDKDIAAKVQQDVVDHEDKVYEPFSDATTPAWLKKELAAADVTPVKNLPGWATAVLLPPLVIGEHRLSDEQIGVVVNLLAKNPVSTRVPLLRALREHVSAGVRDEFAWKLFQSWMEDGAPSKLKWAMGAVGHLGGDGCALKLTPLLRIWPGESQHQRAVFGLECLRAIGSDVALMQLAGIAQKLKFKGLKGKAEQFVGEIAEEKGMTRAELEDRIVPDCGLDENGRREFSFGNRSFSFVLGGNLKAMIRDEAGKVRADLPKPGTKDDAEIAQQSVAEWKLLKKQIRDVAKIQAARLEQAMVTGRRWSVNDFETLLVRHPLMTHLVRQLIWGGFDKQGKRITTFRVTDERDYADAEDNPGSLEKIAVVGVLHPLELSEDERSTWGEVLSDYEIVSPFPQLGRGVYALEEGEDKQTELSRFNNLKLVAPTLVFNLEKMGWIRGEAMDAGCFDEHSKQFPAADVTAVIHYEGTVGMGYIDPDEILTISNVHFVRGMRAPSGYGWGSEKEKLTKLSSVSPVVLSEVLADLHFLKTKAK